MALAEKEEFLYHAVDEAGPLCGWSFRVVDLELYLVLEVDGICYYGISTIRAHLSHYSLSDSTREDESAVVVGVLANEVDTSRRMVNVACKTVKMLYEATSYVFNIHDFILLKIES